MRPFSNLNVASLTLLSMLLVGATGNEGVNWCFSKPECNEDNPASAWNNGLCKDGKLQSPIDVPTPQGWETKEGKSTLSFPKHNELASFLIKNDGNHLIVEDLKTTTGEPASFNWGGRKYHMAEMDMHWGDNDQHGSEHTLAGKSFPFELHLIYHLSEFPNLDEAVKSAKPDAVACISFFAEVDPNAKHHFLEDLVGNLDKIALAGSNATVPVKKMKVAEMLNGHNKALVYNGSYTLPPCDEVVAWIILPVPMKIKPECLKQFRDKVKTFGGKAVSKNYRNRQPTHGRNIEVVNIKG